MIDELKVFVTNPVFDISFSPREEVVHHRYLVSVHHQLVSEVGANKTSSSSNLQQRTHTDKFIVALYVRRNQTVNCFLAKGQRTRTEV